MTRALLFTTLALAMTWPTTAVATPATLSDTTARGALPDGVIGANEYSSGSTGVGMGFGGVIGPATLGVDADVLGNVYWSLSGSTGSCTGNNHVVVYIDSVSGGPTDTTVLTDTMDPGRSAVSGSNANGSADLTFAPGFAPDFALVINGSSVNLFRIDVPGLTFLKTLAVTTIGTNCNAEIGGLTLQDLGLAPGDSFRYVATTLNPNDAAGPFRSNEFHGVTTAPSANLGQMSFTFAQGAFVTFHSPLVLINEVDADTPGADALEFVELRTRPASMDLTGLALVPFNGSDDASYAFPGLPGALGLTGQTSGADGLFVAGSAAVPNVDLVIGVMNPQSPSTNAIQNGADAMALNLDDAALYPNDTPVTSLLVVDAVVYDTNDPDDLGLAVLVGPGSPQIDEDANSNRELDSTQRCDDLPRATSGHVVGLSSPGAPNVACIQPTCQSDADCGTCEFCNVSTNACEMAAMNTPCDGDGDLCTVDACDAAGACVNTSAVDCSSLDSACTQGTCNPTDGMCSPSPVNDTNACDDGDMCTTGTMCNAGVCGGGTNTCQCATDADCAAFEDDDACNGTLVCDANRQCVVDPATVVTCDPTQDTTCMANTCDAATGTCSLQPQNVGMACDDGNTCTGNEACDAAGACAGTNLNDGTACDLDADACSQDTCIAGVCSAGQPVDCSGMDDACNAGTCDPADGSCTAAPIADGTACDDGNACTESDACTAGVCSGSSAANDTACDLDSNQCTADVCMDGACTAGAAVDCADPGACLAAMCDASTGMCVTTNLADGTACDDGDMCTDGDQCVAGICEAGSIDTCNGMGDMGDMADMGQDTMDPGTDMTPDEDGCACRTVHTGPTTPAPLALLMLGLVGWFIRGPRGHGRRA